MSSLSTYADAEGVYYTPTGHLVVPPLAPQPDPTDYPSPTTALLPVYTSHEGSNRHPHSLTFRLIFYVFVDQDLLPALSQYRWMRHYASHLQLYLVRRLEKLSNGAKKTIYLANQILQPPPGKGQTIDFLNHDPRDYRKENLLLVPYEQSNNQHLRKHPSLTGMKGVTKNSRPRAGHPTYRVRLRHPTSRQYIHLGSYLEIAYAGYAYNLAITSLYGLGQLLNSFTPEQAATLDPLTKVAIGLQVQHWLAQLQVDLDQSDPL